MSSVPPPYGPSPPPPPPDEPPGYQPFDSYYRPQQQPAPTGRNARRGGLLGGIGALLAAVWAYGKYILLFGLKFGAVKTLLTLLVSFGVYFLFFGPWFAAALVVMILVHEMGHVVEIRRQGLQATAPLFIPLAGAAIFMRRQPSDPLKQAQVAIAGPLGGTVGATVAFALYGYTHWSPLLLAAYIGFLLNLFNLIPFGFLDGGWILAVVSKWFQLIGLGGLLAVVLFAGFSPIILIVIVLGLPTLFERFRNDQTAYYQSVPVPARLAMGAAWLLLAAYLGFAFLQTHDLLLALVR